MKETTTYYVHFIHTLVHYIILKFLRSPEFFAICSSHFISVFGAGNIYDNAVYLYFNFVMMHILITLYLFLVYNVIWFQVYITCMY